MTARTRAISSSSSVAINFDTASLGFHRSAETASAPAAFVPVAEIAPQVVPIASEPIASARTTSLPEIEAASKQQSVCLIEPSAIRIATLSAPSSKEPLAAKALYQIGIDFKKQSRLEEALAHFLRAAEHNHPAALYEVAFALRHGKGVTKSPDEAVNYLERAAMNRLPVAQYMYAMHLQSNDSMAAAVTWFTQAALQGYVEAQFRLGELNRRGVKGVIRRSATNAVHWYRQAARPRGSKPPNAFALHRLGIAHRDGHGVPESTQIAFHHFEQAASQMHVESMCELGILSLTKDLTGGMKLLGTAAKRGYARAQYHLGLAYVELLSPPQLNVAQIWFGKARDQAHLRAFERMRTTSHIRESLDNYDYDEFDPPHERCLTDDWLAPDERDTGSDDDE